MALRPPRDFAPPESKQSPPSERELRELWERQERARAERERAQEWRALLEGARRDGSGRLRATAKGAVPSYLSDRDAIGPDSRGALRPEPRRGRVAATGLDTFSPCWYAQPGSPLARAMSGLATVRSSFAALLPEAVEGCRVGWFPDSGLVFAEGRLGGEGLLPAPAVAKRMERLEGSLGDLGIGVKGVGSGGLRRLDVAVDLWMDSAVEGLGLLECLASSSLGGGKMCSSRGERGVASVLIKSRAGRTLARIYDKGAQGGAAPRGRWLRLEAQWRFPRGSRIELNALDTEVLRELFRRRFELLWQAAGGFSVGGLGSVTQRIEEAVKTGQLEPSRARSVAGYLVLRSVGVPQGAARTCYELERECRELGLSVSLLRAPEKRVDIATVIDECMAPAAWK